MKRLSSSDTPERHGLRLKRGKNGIYTAPDPGPEAQHEAIKSAFPDANIDPSESRNKLEESNEDSFGLPDL